MRNRTIIALLVITVTLIAGIIAAMLFSALSGHKPAAQQTQPAEIHESFELAAGANVEVRGINGPIQIETSDTNAAEVHITRTARSDEDLARNRVIIERTPTSLSVRAENSREGLWQRFWSGWGGGDAKQEVRLRLPRRIELTVRGVNGKVSTGATEGSLRLNGINGRVEAGAISTNDAEVSGINGSLNLSITRLGGRGARINGVNGAINLSVAEGVNADLSVRGVNGRVTSEMPNVTLEGGEDRSNRTARIGTGGTPLSISGINGRVQLSPMTATN